MPHVVVEGAGDLRGFADGFAPIEERDQTGIRRTADVLVSTRGSRVLIEAVVVETGRTQRFFVSVSNHEHGAAVRLEPLTDPEKTAGVKRLLAAVAGRLAAHFPGARYSKTNLQEYLPA